MLRATLPMQRHQGRTSWYTNVQCREESIHSPPEELSCGILPMQLLFSLYHQETEFPATGNCEQTEAFAFCCGGSSFSLSPCYQVMLTQPLNCWVQEEKARRKRSLTSLRRRLLLPTVLCTAPGLPAKASQSAKVVSTTCAMLPGGCCWGFARQRTTREDCRKG